MRVSRLSLVARPIEYRACLAWLVSDLFSLLTLGLSYFLSLLQAFLGASIRSELMHLDQPSRKEEGSDRVL